MRNRKAPKAEIAVIGGTGLESFFESAEEYYVGTPFGLPPPVSVGNISGRRVAFLPRHCLKHSLPPHKIDYRANIHALNEMGVERVIATNAVGAVNMDFKPGELAVPHDLIDLTKLRSLTFFDDARFTHVDFSEPYCPEIRKALVEKAAEAGLSLWERAVYVCTEGPRFETPAEIRMFRALGGDLVGMTAIPEAVLARESGICYGALCFITNMAAGIAGRISAKEVTETSKRLSLSIRRVLVEAIKCLPKAHHCQCASSATELRAGEA